MGRHLADMLQIMPACHDTFEEGIVSQSAPKCGYYRLPWWGAIRLVRCTSCYSVTTVPKKAPSHHLQ